MNDKLQVVVVLAALGAGIYGFNRLLMHSANATNAQMASARTYVARHRPRYQLEDCERSETDHTRILCNARAADGRKVSLRIDFTPDGAVSGTCIAGTAGCLWNP